MELAMADGLLTAKFSEVMTWLFLGILLLKVFCLFDAAFRREDAFRAADKQKKSFWLILLGVAVVVDVLPTGLGLLLMLAGLVAAIVYLVDVRPALKQVGGRRGGGGTHMGPYGPW